MERAMIATTADCDRGGAHLGASFRNCRSTPACSRSGALLIICWLASGSAGAVEKFTNADCLDCHLDPSTTRKVDGKTVSLLFPTNSFQKSVHAKLDCVDCHTGIKDLVHPSKLPPPKCAGCHETRADHEQAAADYATSIHVMSHTLGAS